MVAQGYSPERRPIASREASRRKRLAHWLAQRGISPNTISVIGMVLGVAAGPVLAATTIEPWRRWGFLAAAVLMQLRLLANMLDGMVAVESGKASPVGELYNEVPDRVSDTAACVGAGYAAGSHPALGFVAALLAVFLAYLRAQGRVAGATQEFCGPLAKPQRVFLLTLLAAYCGMAPDGWQPTLARWPSIGVMGIGLGAMILGEVWTAVRRLRRISQALKEIPR